MNLNEYEVDDAPTDGSDDDSDEIETDSASGENLDCAGNPGATDFSKALMNAAGRLRGQGIVIVISDLYDEPDNVMSGLRHLAFRGNDVIVFQLLDPAEIQFDFADSAQFVDMETKAEMHVIPDYLRQEYRKLLSGQVSEYEKECRKDRMDYALIDTSKSLDSALFSYLVRRQQLY